MESITIELSVEAAERALDMIFEAQMAGAYHLNSADDMARDDALAGLIRLELEKR